MRSPATRRPRRALLACFAGLLLLVPPACADGRALEAARVALDRFQDALFAGDRDGLRRALASSSRVLVPHLPLQRTRDKLRLVVVGAVARPPEVLVSVEDPNDGGRRHTYVLVKEDGELLLDLVATTAYNHRVERAVEGQPRFSPDALHPEEIARIRSRWSTAFR